MDPSWIKKIVGTALLCLFPAIALLIRVWFKTAENHGDSGNRAVPFWIESTVVLSYGAWLLNAKLEISELYLLLWPLAAALASFVSSVAVFANRGKHRLELAIVGILLTVQCLAVVITPN